MARNRRQPESLESGSDSFLDIIANIVGILIILIVIAGVRVSQTPAQVDFTEQPDSVAHSAVVITLPIPEKPLPATPEPVVVKPVVPVQKNTVKQSINLAKQTNELNLQRQKMQETIDQQHLKFAQLTRLKSVHEVENKKLQYSLAISQQNLFRLKQSHHRNSLGLKNSQKEQGALVHAIADLDQLLVKVQRDQQPSQVLEHAILPLGKVVSGQEWHFELRGGRVSFIPLDEFMEQMKKRIQQKASWIVKYEKYEGLLGPVAGFHLKFSASRQKRTLSDELTFGASRVMIGLDKWELIPSEANNRETAKQAMQPGSLFHTELQRISTDDTITFWVYPDSFLLYQKLIKVVHQKNLQAAARPIPAGKKISGSPQGSRSVSQ